MAATPAFMSDVPRPNSRSPSASPANGSTTHGACPSGTTSRWPVNPRAGASASLPAMRDQVGPPWRQLDQPGREPRILQQCSHDRDRVGLVTGRVDRVLAHESPGQRRRLACAGHARSSATRAGTRSAARPCRRSLKTELTAEGSRLTSMVRAAPPARAARRSRPPVDHARGADRNEGPAALQRRVGLVHAVGHLAEPDDVRPQPPAHGAARADRFHAQVDIPGHRGAARAAQGAHQLAVEMDQPPAARALVQIVDVLGHQQELPGQRRSSSARARWAGLGAIDESRSQARRSL